jgi:hypothetical protein
LALSCCFGRQECTYYRSGQCWLPHSHHASLVKLILPSRDRPCSSCITSLREMQPFEGIVHRPCLSLRPRQHGLNRYNIRVSSAQQRSCDSAIYMIHIRIERRWRLSPLCDSRYIRKAWARINSRRRSQENIGLTYIRFVKLTGSARASPMTQDKIGGHWPGVLWAIVRVR